MLPKADERGRSQVVAKRSVVVDGHKTSISLEADFWEAFKEIAASQGVSPGDLVATIDRQRQHSNLSSAIRLLVLNYYRKPGVKLHPKKRRGK
jgi:predicted DNA-binding ribbon-helix-helix protein